MSNTRHSSRTVQAPPPHIARVMERVREDDRAFFAANPGERARVRPFVRGESWPFAISDCEEVLVRPLAPGVRLVLPFKPTVPSLLWRQIDLDRPAGRR